MRYGTVEVTSVIIIVMSIVAFIWVCYAPWGMLLMQSVKAFQTAFKIQSVSLSASF